MLKQNEDQITSSDDDNQINNMVASNMKDMQPQKFYKCNIVFTY